MIQEESIILDIEIDKITKKLPVFYNPVMKLNRDVTILLLNSIDMSDMQMALPLAGSGIRGLRFLKELNKGKIKNIHFNDYKTTESIKRNIKHNLLDQNLCEFHSIDANLFLLNSTGFDYIDIDPFGSPNPFLESSIVRLARGGILAVTATDTAALSGSSKDACIRKYWARPLRNEFMHETALRILIRKVQLMGAQNEKALTPIFSYSKDHYYRVFFKCEKGRQKVDELLKCHGFLIYDPKTTKREIVKDIFNKQEGWEYAGPIWIGELWDKNLVEDMCKNCSKDNKKLYSLIELINEEKDIDSVGFYDLHKIAKLKKTSVKKMEEILSNEVKRTHFLGWGVRSKKMPI